MENLQQARQRPTNRPSRCTSLYMKREQFLEVFDGTAQEFIESLESECNTLRDELAGVCDKRFVLFKNKALWFDRDVAGLYPRWDKVALPQFTYYASAKTIEQFRLLHQDNLKLLNQDGLEFSLMTKEEVRSTFKKGNGNPYIQAEGRLREKLSGRGVLWACFAVNLPLSRGYATWYSIAGDEFLVGSRYKDDSKAILIPIHRLYGKNASPMDYEDAFYAWLIMGLLPEGLNEEQEERYMALADTWGKLEKELDFFIDVDDFSENVMEGHFTDPVLSHKLNFFAAWRDACSGEKPYIGSADSLKKYLLRCDEVRANIQPYDERLLSDVNRGHWELFESPDDGDEYAEVQFPADEMVYARPPQLDVRTNGTCAIDFGTKSTVVVCRDGEERMLRIGKGDYAKAPTMRDFENPTVVELRDIEGFLAAYRGRAGRPFTEWNQVTVSHQAADAIFRDQETCGSVVYNSVFSELKQWAREEDRWPILIDREGNTREIKPYAETSAMDDGEGGGDFDPIELYAYYLGLYINNMHHQIYLDYILSFPVNYKKAVRERIRASFERGLKKSLPPALLKDESMMRRFRVYLGASEPAAYAISALEGFGLEPKSVGEKVAYGVFDFGGGTTDFDFGIEYVPENGRRNFIIEQFGFNGDELLGGENILELLAYEVYKKNLPVMREQKIPFALPAGCDIFAGAEMLVQRTGDASAHMNRRILAEKLRPLWESDDEGIEKLTGDTLNVTLFSSVTNTESGSSKVGVDLHVDVEMLRQVIERRIRQGVENFFQSLLHAFKGKSLCLPIHIFLAGNSCRSPVVKTLFEQHIAKEEKKIAEMMLKNGQVKDAKGAFCLHEPLGLQEEAKEGEGKAKAKAKAASLSMDFDRKRTGKTGVAFGLLRCRKGGKDVKIVNGNVDDTGEVRFPYYLGDAGNLGKYFTVRIGKGVGYGEWAAFTFADEPEFELYYTSEPRALQDDMPIGQVQMVHCLLDEADVSDDDDVRVYIRKVAPNAIEYAVGCEEDFEKDEEAFRAEFSGKIYSQSL